LKLNQKAGFPTSLKYQSPGEELCPSELISITGDDDLQVHGEPAGGSSHGLPERHAQLHALGPPADPTPLLPTSCITQELIDEYQAALGRAAESKGTESSSKQVRVKVFLFPAAIDELDTQAT
jgi:hypothetical protein